ncbi:hypothetical protein F5Y14DRAFT_454560 [Nemania sp. NC0429]|nr:hypothetical protein F5Y14DRAFT_454560 [Nemania sp. NC0429]
MDSLRKQLSETQGALTERNVKFRQVKADHAQAVKSWLEEKAALESKITRLEAENLRINGARNDTQNTDGDDTVTISRSEMEEAKQNYANMGKALDAKTKQCETLEAKLARSGPTSIAGLTEDQVVARWNQLRDQIRTLSLEYLSKPFPVASVTNEDEFKMLSPHWKSYATTPNMTYYLLRALIWRYMIRYFEVPCRAWGRDISNKVGEIAEPLISRKAPEEEIQVWRIRTAALVGKTFPIDTDYINEITTKLAKATLPLAGEADPAALEAALRSVVTAAAELGAVLDQSRFVVLMSNAPGSALMHGFPFVENVMDMRAKLSSKGLVDLMVTPGLFKKEANYSVVVKAEVIC